MKVKFILPALTEAKSPYWRPIKYSLFPPLGLATLAGYLSPYDSAEIIDEHVEPLIMSDRPDLVVIQVYITNAYRAYAIADQYRREGVYVALGGLHVTSLPEEAARHADSVFLGPGEETFPEFLSDFRKRETRRVYFSLVRSLEKMPRLRRDLIKRKLYLVPNSIVVSRGCPHHCSFCYKDSFFKGGRSFYLQPLDDVLLEIESSPGRHLYFLDDHLLAHPGFARALFKEMVGMNRVFQCAATVDSILRGDLIEKAEAAGLRSLFVGFESLAPANLALSNKSQNRRSEYENAVNRLHELGIMINGSFVFGMEEDDGDVFRRTVDWALENGITTATFHILTPYPGTALYKKFEAEGRITTTDWSLYDTRHVVFKTRKLSAEELKEGYDWAYTQFYKWGSIVRASSTHDKFRHSLKHFIYASGWKKFESAWNFLIKARQLNRMLPLLETLLSEVGGRKERPGLSRSDLKGGTGNAG